MVRSVQEHFHVLTTIPAAVTTDGEWRASADGGRPQFWPMPMVMAAPRYSLDGTFHAHVLKDGATPVVFKGYRFTLYLDTWEEYETWEGYLGTQMYLVPIYHDPAAHDQSAALVYVSRLGDPDTESYRYQYIKVPVEVMDASTT